MIKVRPATPDDLKEVGAEASDEFCIGDVLMYAAERDGELVGTGQVTVDKWGRYWGWFNRRGDVPAITMHKTALHAINELRVLEGSVRQEILAEGKTYVETALYAICHPGIPGSAKWLERLGFVVDENLTHPQGLVYRCDLI
jgi:hypothetical protein